MMNVLLLLLVLPAACGPAAAPAPAAPAPTAAKAAGVPAKAAQPAAAPAATAPVVITTPTPPSAGTPDQGTEHFDRIRASGRVIVGTSGGLAPFASESGDAPLDGYDLALARELGRRMGLQVSVKDLVGESLPGALQVGQIDLAIATLAPITDGAMPVAFTAPYFLSTDTFLARQEAGPAQLSRVADLAARKIGVQQGSRFEAWLRSSLVSTGQMASANLAVYRELGQGVADLKAGRLDLLLLDASQARGYLGQGGLRQVGGGLMASSVAAAVPAGSTRFRDEISRMLTQMGQDGTLIRLAEQYLGPGPADPFLPRQQGIEPQPPPNAALTGCVDGMTWVSDLTFPDDGSQPPVSLQIGETFTKAWRVRNTGTCTWGAGYILAFSRGSSPAAQMSGRPVQLTSAVPPGAELDLSLSLVAPVTPGGYSASWELRNSRDVAFGERLRVRIAVRAAPSPTPTTPTPQALPPSGSFAADRARIRPGECTSIAWNIEGVQAIFFYNEGQPWEQHPATGQEVQQICPPGSTAYELRIVRLDGSTELRRVAITVDNQSDVPINVRLTTTPESAVRAGNCLNLVWEAQGNISYLRITRNEAVIWENAPQVGSLRDCPAGTGDKIYIVTAVGPTKTVQTQRVIKVSP